jgi:hypothetical protein
MPPKIDCSKYDLEIKSSLSAQEASEAIFKRTGVKVSSDTIRRRRKLVDDTMTASDSGADGGAVAAISSEQSETTPELEVKPESPKRRGKAAKFTPEEAKLHQMARYNTTAAMEAANAGEVEEIRELVGKTYTVESVAAAFGVTVRAVQGYLKSGKLKGKKIFGAWQISAESIKSLVDI